MFSADGEGSFRSAGRVRDRVGVLNLSVGQEILRGARGKLGMKREIPQNSFWAHVANSATH